MSVNFRIDFNELLFLPKYEQKCKEFCPGCGTLQGRNRHNFSFIFLEKGWLYKFILKFTDLYLMLILYARKELAVERFKMIKAILKQNSVFPVYWLLLPLHITLSICFLFQYQCPIYYWSCRTDERFSDIFIIVIHTWIKGIDKANALSNTVCKFSWFYHIC